MNTSPEARFFARGVGGHDAAAVGSQILRLDAIVVEDDGVITDDPGGLDAIFDLPQIRDAGLLAGRGKHIR